MKFVDEARIHVKSGKGGPGAISFRREAKVPRGGPDGGDGGRGGDVVFVVDQNTNSLIEFQFTRNYFAQNGEPGRGQKQSGSDGETMRIHVPPGTLVKDEEGQLLYDLSDATQEFVFLKGGLGGKGNTYYKSSINQAPEKAQKGLPGEARTLYLELKLIADVGLLGRPNAGKSTFISKVSAAKPKIADYPFTTLVPNLGVVRYHDFRSFVVADIPGLIKGASDGVGLGHQFLRHVERTQVLVHLIDISEMNELEPWESYDEIMTELKKRDGEMRGVQGFTPLLERPQIVVLNKSDIVSDELIARTRKKFADQNINVHVASTATGQGLDKIVDLMADVVFQNGEEDS